MFSKFNPISTYVSILYLCSLCINYAKALADKHLPIIYDIHHFSQLIGIRLDFLLAISNSPRNFYRYFTIPKASGKFRKIAEPLPILKDIQHYILHNILKKIPCSIYAKAFKPRASLKGNAKFHRNQQTLIKLDITDYFSNLHESKVFYLFFHTVGYSKSLSTLLQRLERLSYRSRYHLLHEWLCRPTSG